ncbi:MAG TPA: CDP-alcohol phosphatidyltransferase family protein [Acidimicrobiales bacterium]|nr:CDP-alcohol phosphatidyltransferase family protein [Acidimicrobiales bacterium]
MFDGRFRQAVDHGTKPVGETLVRVGVTADVLTVFGLAMSVLTAFVVGSGHFLWGIAMLFATGLPDLFDGPVAKASGTASIRGAFFDSVADRVADGFMFGGVAWYLAAHHHGEMVLLPFAILAAVSLISYQRAKAELLGLSASGGLMERAERFILLGVCFVAAAISVRLFVPALWVFFGLVLLTALERFVRVWNAAEGPVRFPVADGVEQSEYARRAIARWRQARADSRWRAWREARAERSAGPQPARPRVAAEPLGRWRARRAAVPQSRTAHVWRARRAARARERAGRRAGGI